MYNLTDSQVSSLETFIGKIDESIIRSKIQKWFDEVEPTRRVTSEQMERFVEFAVHLPVETQYFPSSFALAVKNTPETDRMELAGEGTEPADLIGLVDDSISDVSDVDATDDEEESEHTLGKTKKVGRKPKDKLKAKK